MTVHKLSGGDGYTYLTRQVASADVARARGQDLAGYYATSGSPPGRWVGSGAAAHLGVGGVVDEGQMKALFGRGMHHDADRIAAAVLAAGGTPAGSRAAGRLGRPFPDFDVLPPLSERVAKRLAGIHADTGQEPDPATVQRVRVEEGRREHRPVAGYDLVFTPVKSVSLLWALGDDRVRAAVAAAHHETGRRGGGRGPCSPPRRGCAGPGPRRGSRGSRTWRRSARMCRPAPPRPCRAG